MTYARLGTPQKAERDEPPQQRRGSHFAAVRGFIQFTNERIIAKRAPIGGKGTGLSLGIDRKETGGRAAKERVMKPRGAAPRGSPGVTDRSHGPRPQTPTRRQRLTNYTP